ncbi:hypothetical protein AVEN_75040-1 [Araneus ventricosus]|uniref:Uncharacterized protein n=1 Tax=Araneus ventricosus TaxID=182803 RepID=A0A4Y2AFQ6_ARAVE|nr:hypothetical protein AVEN_67769-1 [Araneus ventricosus]GBL78640.1 hypothetical protein AVEN_75040-1 [Araneus ventricosus]
MIDEGRKMVGGHSRSCFHPFPLLRFSILSGSKNPSTRGGPDPAQGPRFSCGSSTFIGEYTRKLRGHHISWLFYLKYASLCRRKKASFNTVVSTRPDFLLLRMRSNKSMPVSTTAFS